MELLIVTGMSGAGKSTAINALEDLGFYCIDNLPQELVITFARLIANSRDNTDKVAIVTDIRGGDSFDKLFEDVSELSRDGFEYKILFLDSSDEVLVRRYKETRRKHPLYNESDNSITMAVKNEREILLPLREHADFIVDTSLISIAQLKERLANLILNTGGNGMHVHCMSFGFKYGLPTEADLVFDVRCLPNPFYIQELKTHTGLEKPVRDYVMKWEQSKIFAYKLCDFLKYVVPLYRNEGKSQLVISVGCTGGKHRSVVFAEMINKQCQDEGFSTSVQHRDIAK